MILIQYGTASPREELVISDAIHERPARAPDHKAESRILGGLASRSETNPDELYDTYAEAALELCRAGSAGVRILGPADGSGDGDGDEDETLVLTDELDMPPDDARAQALEITRACLDQGKSVFMARPFPRFADGNVMPSEIVEALAVPLHAGDERPVGVIWVAIHDHRQGFDEEDLRVLTTLAALLSRSLRTIELLAERDLLLQEVRHRTINDLQMVASLLSLQRYKLPGRAAQAVLNDVVVRIQTIARVRAATTPSSFGPRADLSVALRDLVSAAAAMTATQEISLTIDMIDEIETMHPDQVLLLALVVNELVTNAIKHAFPGGRQGHIEVTAWRASATELGIGIRDDGIAFEQDITALRCKSLGFRLIERLLARMGGRLVYPTGQSKEFVIRVPFRVQRA